MQTISFVGKIYGMKMATSGKNSRLSFRVAVRKKYVSDEDKKANKVNVFVPVVAFGKTAELIEQYFEDGDMIGLNNCEYCTFETEDDEGEVKYSHNFKVNDFAFVSSAEDSGGSSKKSSSKSSSRRRRGEEEDEDDSRSRRKKKTDTSGKKKRPVYDDDDGDDDANEDDLPF